MNTRTRLQFVHHACLPAMLLTIAGGLVLLSLLLPAGLWRGLCVGAVLLCLITAAWLQARQLRDLRDRLQDREARLQLALNATGLGLWDYHADHESVGSDAYAAQMLGYVPEHFSETRSAFVARLHPDDRVRVRTAFRDYVTGARREYDEEFRMRLESGEYRWFRSTGQVMARDAAGHALRVVGTYQDVTERRATLQQLSQLSARLLTLQEEERRNLAAELHDDFGQQLTALKLNLHVLRAQVHDSGALQRWQDCVAIVSDTLARVRQRVFDLRPPQLDDFGLEAALEDYCRRQEERSGACIMLDVADGLDALNDRVTLVAFRVVQEGVNNALRHGKADEIQVALKRDAVQLLLSVSDNGTGILPAVQVAQGTSAGGVGLLAMRERIAALGGTLEIQPGTAGGVVLQARLPLNGVEKEEA